MSESISRRAALQDWDWDWAMEFTLDFVEHSRKMT